jgi:hypothetical protein
MNFFRLCDGGATQARAAFSDLPKRPVNGLAHEVSGVVRLPCHEREQVEKDIVGQIFPVHRARRDQDKTGAFHELGATPCPRDGFLQAEGRAVEKVSADLIAEIPGVEAARPDFHLLPRDCRGIRDVHGQNAGLVDAAVPELESERLVFAMRSREFAERHNADPELFGAGRDAEAALAGDIDRIAEPAECGDEFREIACRVVFHAAHFLVLALNPRLPAPDCRRPAESRKS